MCTQAISRVKQIASHVDRLDFVTLVLDGYVSPLTKSGPALTGDMPLTADARALLTQRVTAVRAGTFASIFDVQVDSRDVLLLVSA